MTHSLLVSALLLLALTSTVLATADPTPPPGIKVLASDGVVHQGELPVHGADAARVRFAAPELTEAESQLMEASKLGASVVPYVVSGSSWLATSSTRDQN